MMGKESPQRRKPGGHTPRTKLPHVVGSERVVEEGGYAQDSPLAAAKPFDLDTDYGNGLQDGTHSDADQGEPELQLGSRADGRAWEGGDASDDKDPLAQGFRELRILAQVVRKKAGTKDFESEMNALEVKLKRVHAHAGGELAAVLRQQKTLKKANASLQEALKGAKQTVNQTVSQAFDDVSLLTAKLKSLEESLSQARIDKEHIEKGFRSELAAVQAKNSSLQKHLLSCKLDLEDLSHRTKVSDEEIRQLKFDKLEAQKEATLLRQQLAVFDDDLTAAKHREAKALKDVQGMKDELDLERANLRDELEGFAKAREAVNQELVRVQVDRDNALKDAKKVEEYKEMNLELKKALAQAQLLLDEAETVRNNGAKALLEATREEKEELQRASQHKLSAVEDELRIASEQLAALQKKAADDAEQASVELEALRTASAETAQTLTAANELLTQEQAQLKDDLVQLQAHLADKLQQVADLSASTSVREAAHEQVAAQLREAITALQEREADARAVSLEQEVHIERMVLVVASLHEGLARLADWVHGQRQEAAGEAQASRAQRAAEGEEQALAAQHKHEQEMAALRAEAEDAAERQQRAEDKAAALEAKVKQVRMERDAMSALSKNFMLQLSRSKVERLAAISLSPGATGSSAGASAADASAAPPVQQQLEHVKQILESARKDHNDLNAAAAAVLTSEYVKGVSEARIHTPDVPAGLVKPHAPTSANFEPLPASTPPAPAPSSPPATPPATLAAATAAGEAEAGQADTDVREAV